MNKSFWIDRIKEFGHTGWSDRLTYLYDQNMRLNLVESIIKKYFKNSIDYSLDYGCGSGDFTNLLAQYSVKTIGVDIAHEIIDIAKVNYQNINNLKFSLIDREYVEQNSYDLINLITVLQHILDDDDLNNVLSMFNRQITDNGIMIIIDSFGKDINSDYLKFRDYDDFLDTLKDNNFKIVETHTLYHPQAYPTKLFDLYRKNIMVRVLNKLGFLKILNKIAYKISKYDSPLSISSSETKLIIAKKFK